VMVSALTDALEELDPELFSEDEEIESYGEAYDFDDDDDYELDELDDD
jgi:hypothetical protein